MKQQKYNTITHPNYPVTENARRFRPTKSKSDPSNILISEHTEVNEVSALISVHHWRLTFTPKQPKRIHLNAVWTSRRFHTYIYAFNGRKWTISYKWTFCMFYNELELPSRGIPKRLRLPPAEAPPISCECVFVPVCVCIRSVINITVLVYPVWSTETHDSVLIYIFIIVLAFQWAH